MKKQTIEQEAKNYIRQCHFVLANEINIYPLSEIKREILNSRELMSLYDIRDENKLIRIYHEKLSKLKEMLYDEDEETYILNILEYFKFLISKEQFVGIEDILYFEGLDDYVFSSTIIGRGTSCSQARLLQELLDDEDYELTEIRKAELENPYANKGKFYVLLKDDEYIDPYHYGKSEEDEITYYYTKRVRERKFDKEKQKKAQEKISKIIIRQLGIDKMSKNIDEDDNILDKISKIVEIIKLNKTNEQVQIRYNTIKINGRIIEASRLIELFLIHNNIPYEAVQKDEKENQIFIINIQGIEIIINTAKILASNREKEKIYQKKIN